MQINPELEEKCKQYGTKLNFCGCMGFEFRKYCRHISYLKEKIQEKYIELGIISNSIPVEGIDYFKLEQIYGAQIIDEMVALGHAFESKDRCIIIPLR